MVTGADGDESGKKNSLQMAGCFLTDATDLLEPITEYAEILWWTVLGLNQRPPPCEGGALPLS